MCADGRSDCVQNSDSPAEAGVQKPAERLERAKGFEPSTPTLARSCSTPELHPHPSQIVGQ